MDITKVAAETSTDDTPIELEVFDRHGEPYVGKDGKPTVFLIVGEYSKQYRKTDREITNRVIREARRGVADLSAEDAEQHAAARLAAGVVGWRNVEDAEGNPVPFSTQNVTQLLKDAPWIAQRVSKAIRGHASFFVNGSQP